MARPFRSLATVTRLLAAVLLAAALSGAASPARAAEEGCPGLVSWGPARIIPASLATGEVRITYVGHSTFLMETAAGTTIATDYNDYVRPTVVPRIATMNRAHSTHYSNNPPAGIGRIMRGWNPTGGPARWDEQLGDVRVRNVVTNIRTWGGDTTERDGNSIFVFETADLCIAHLGHLHHTLTPEHLKQLGRIDVLLVPVDGSYTLDLDGMMEVVAAISPRLMIPMHFFGQSTLNHFLARAEKLNFKVERPDSPVLVLSRPGLPAVPTVIALPGY